MSHGSKARRGGAASQRRPLDWTGACCKACPWPSDDDETMQPYCRNAQGVLDPDRLARAYALDKARSDEFPEGTVWAHMCVWSMLQDHPAEALEIMRRAALATTTDRQRTMIGCGNLESLLGGHGPVIIGDVERLARESPAFRECLSHVWQHGMPDDIWRRVLAASGREVPPRVKKS